MLTEAQRQQLHKELKARGWELVPIGNDCMEWRNTRWRICSQDADIHFTQDVCAILGVEIYF